MLRLDDRLGIAPRRTAALLLFLVLLAAASARASAAQARPSGTDRVWGELGFAGARQDFRCAACVPSIAFAGPVVSLTLGVTLPRGWGVAAQARAFQAVSFDYTQGSRYGVVLAQYMPRIAPAITFNAGPGWVAHRGDPALYTQDGSSAVLAAGVAVRVPQRSTAGLSLTVDVTQALGGAASSRARLLSVGLGLNLAGPVADRGVR